MKKILVLIATLAVVLLGLVMPTTAYATGDETCVPSEGTAAGYTDWLDEGEPVRTEENVAPGTDGDLIRWVSAGTVDEQVQTGTKEEFDHWQRYSLAGGSWKYDFAPTFTSGSTETGDPEGKIRWQPNVEGDPHDIGVAGVYDRSNESSGNTDWYALEAVTKTVPVYGTDTDYFWQKQVKEFVPAVPPVECSDEPTDPVDECLVEPELCGGDEGGNPGTDPKDTDKPDTTVKHTVKRVVTDEQPKVVERASDEVLPNTGAGENIILGIVALLLITGGFALTRRFNS